MLIDGGNWYMVAAGRVRYIVVAGTLVDCGNRKIIVTAIWG